MPKLILFEDDRAGFFEPVALTRTVARLRVGLWTQRERWGRLLPGADVALLCREDLARVEKECGEWAAVNEVPDGEALFVSSAVVGTPPAGAKVRELAAGVALVSGGRIVAARAGTDAAREIAGALREAAGTDLLGGGGVPDGGRLAETVGLAVREDETLAEAGTLVDLVAGNAEAIRADFADLDSGRPPDPSAHPGVHVLSPDCVRLGEGVRIDPGAVLDAREGPIVLGRGTRVEALCALQGPLAAGRDCIFRSGARVGPGVSLGPVSRIGGEVHDSIVQGFSNKQHDGFLGSSYLGCWVNLGAATDTSDLKNDYGPVTIRLAGEAVATGRTGVGSLIGDHSKTAIHTRLNTGSVIGVSANVLAAGFPDRETPSFTWGGGTRREEYRLAKAVEVAAAVTARRGCELGPADEGLFARIHALTAERRREWLAR